MVLRYLIAEVAPGIFAATINLVLGSSISLAVIVYSAIGSLVTLNLAYFAGRCRKLELVFQFSPRRCFCYLR